MFDFHTTADCKEVGVNNGYTAVCHKRLKIFSQINILACADRNVYCIGDLLEMSCIVPGSNVLDPSDIVLFKALCEHDAVLDADVTEVVDCKGNLISDNVADLSYVILKIVHAFLR